MADNNNVELNFADLKQCLDVFCSKIGNEDFSQNQKEFSQLWKKYVNEKGYDDFAEKVLIESFQYNSINYWKDLWKKACDNGHGDAFFEKFLSGKMIKNKGRGQLMVTLGVLSICIDEYKNAGRFIGPVLNLLNGLLPGKDDALDIKELEILFLKRIREKIDDIELSIKKPPKNVLGFFKRMKDCYQGKKLGAEDKLNKEKIESLITLLSESKKKEKDKTEIQSKQEEVKQASSESNAVDVEQVRKELNDAKSKNKELRESKKKLEDDLEDFRLFYKQELNSWKEERGKYEKQQKNYQNSLNAKKLDIENLNVEIENLKQQVDQLTDEINRKNEELQDKNQSIRILKESRDDRFEEKMKSIQKQLIVFYAPFQTCCEEKMSIELGEAMRTYLENVFNIVINNGINLNQQ